MQVENEVRKSAGDQTLKMRDTVRSMESDRDSTRDKLKLIEKEAQMNTRKANE